MFRKMLMKGAFLAFLPLLANCLVVNQATASEFPTKPIQLIVTWAAGGITDVIARLISGKSNEYMGQPMVVLNKTGGGGVIGADFVAKSAPDGHTLLLGASGITSIIYAISPRMPYDPLKDFTPICQLIAQAPIILVKENSQLNTFEKLIDYAKKNFGKLTYGSAGIGSSQHFLGETLQRVAGINWVHLPFKGNAPALMSLLGGHIDLVISDVVATKEQIKAGKVIPLVVSSENRFWGLPEVPSLAEKGYAEAVIVAWLGIVGPAKLPETVVNRLVQFSQKCLSSADVQNRMRELWLTPTYKNPAELSSLIKNEVHRFSDLAKKANIKLPE